jgi:8-oxo-dGTP pyrophosphatase MutT (NUDIX family)
MTSADTTGSADTTSGVSRHVRDTARVLLHDGTGRVLLFFTNYSVNVDRPPRWITPGGGIDPGETPPVAATRELFEETGLVVDTVGPAVWEHDFERQRIDGGLDVGHSTFFAVRSARFTPLSDNWMPDEFDDIHAHRWWSADELEAEGAPFEPAELPDLIRRFALGGE